MITETELNDLIKAAFPDAETALYDKTGMSDHFRLWVSSRLFEGKNLLEQHQMVYQAVDAALKDGRLHALEIKTDIPASAS